MIFRDDDIETKVQQGEHCGSLIVKILNEKQTRQGTKYQVKTNYLFVCAEKAMQQSPGNQIASITEI